MTGGRVDGRADGRTGGQAGGWGAVMLLLGLVLLTTGRALGNGFAFDDVPIIVENSQIHDLAAPWVYAHQSYWPPKNLGDAYRPWTVWWFALQWAMGGGAPWLFHLGNLLLTAVTTLLVLALGVELLGPFGAIAAAALFAVHPLHVEATANIVGQGELWMTAFALGGCVLYLRARRRGALGPASRITLAVLLVLAAGSKEQGIVLPGLLLALEYFVVPSFRAESLPVRLKSLAPTYGLLAVVGVGFLGFRYWVLGDLGGGPPAAGLEGLGLGGRAATMLPLVTEWARLLVWPARLLSQYSPPAHGASTGFGAGALLGAGIVAVAAAIGWLSRRRHPAIGLGLTWIGLSLLPVSNVPFPTGVLVAERTLFLPSVGIVVIGGAMLEWLAGNSDRWAPAILGLCLLVMSGAARSWARQPVWHDNLTLFAQTVIDEPRSYRGHFVLGRELVRRGDQRGALAAYQRAGDLYRGDYRVFEEWGQIQRAAGRCDLAIPIFERGVGANPDATVARSRLFECLYALGDYAKARAVAVAGVERGLTEFTALAARASRRIAAPPARPPPSR